MMSAQAGGKASQKVITMDASALDYEFEVAGDKYIAEHQPSHVNILDSEGDVLVHVFNYANLYDADKTFPLPMAQMLVVGYQQGVKDGIDAGIARSQREIKKALGF